MLYVNMKYTVSHYVMKYKKKMARLHGQLVGQRHGQLLRVRWHVTYLDSSNNCDIDTNMLASLSVANRVAVTAFSRN